MKGYHYILLVLSVTFTFGCQKQVFHYAYEHHANIRVDQKVSAIDSATFKMILPYKSKLDVQMNEVIGYNVKEMVKARPSSTLTNFIADAVVYGFEKKTGRKVDAAILNYGGLRISSLGAGDITRGEVYEIMPFENQLVIMPMTSSELQKLLNRIAKIDGWPMSIGTSFTIKDSTAVDVTINGWPIQENKTYTIALPDYVANGGDNTEFLKTMQREETGILVRDLIMLYVTDTKQIIGDEKMRIIKNK